MGSSPTPPAKLDNLEGIEMTEVTKVFVKCSTDIEKHIVLGLAAGLDYVNYDWCQGDERDEYSPLSYKNDTGSSVCFNLQEGTAYITNIPRKTASMVVYDTVLLFQSSTYGRTPFKEQGIWLNEDKDYMVNFLPNGDIEVGCQKIKFAVLEQIYEKALEKT